MPLLPLSSFIKEKIEKKERYLSLENAYPVQGKVFPAARSPQRDAAPQPGRFGSPSRSEAHLSPRERTPAQSLSRLTRRGPPPLQKPFQASPSADLLPAAAPGPRRAGRAALTPRRQTFSSLRAMATQTVPLTSAEDAAPSDHSPCRSARTEARGGSPPPPSRRSYQATSLRKAARTRRHLG